jgi:hypothetical protein
MASFARLESRRRPAADRWKVRFFYPWSDCGKNAFARQDECLGYPLAKQILRRLLEPDLLTTKASGLTFEAILLIALIGIPLCETAY